MELPLDLVPWPPMSAVIAMVREEGVVLVADRRTVVAPRVEGRPGTAVPGDDEPKLGITAGGCAWAIGGHVGVGGLDLREVVASNPASDPALAARELRKRFDLHADEVRSGAWDEAGFPLPEAFSRAHVVAVVAGMVDGVPEVRMVGLMVDGPATETVLGQGAIKVLAPPPLGGTLPLSLEPVLRSGLLEDAADRIAVVVRSETRSMIDLVSPDFDAIVLSAGKGGMKVRHLPVPEEPTVWS